jgi:LPS-assembly lipoprotein
MSLPNASGRTGGTKRALALLVAGAALLGGCQVRPLYGSLTPGNASTASHVQSELAAIQIDTIDTIGGNTRRVLLTELMFNFDRGHENPAKNYRLELVGNVSSTSVGVEQLADVPASYTMTMNVTFVLYDKATDRTLMTGKSFASASFDFSSQRFANIRAQRDAEERVAKQVAQDMTARLAGYFATRK